LPARKRTVSENTHPYPRTRNAGGSVTVGRTLALATAVAMLATVGAGAGNNDSDAFTGTSEVKREAHYQESITAFYADGNERTIVSPASVTELTPPSAVLAAGKKKCKKKTVTSNGKKKKICKVKKPPITVARPQAPAPADPAEMPSLPTENTGNAGNTENITGMPPLGSTLEGESYAYTSVSGGIPARWDACSPIRYLINTSTMGAGWVEVVHAAVTVLGQSSGYTFQYAGETNVRPFETSNWHETGETLNSLYISFSDQTRLPALAGLVVGMGGPVTLTDSMGSEPRIVVGGLTIDTDNNLLPTLAAGNTLGVALLHELGHVMNLAHVNDRTQIMFPVMRNGTQPQYGRGDTAGLQGLAQRGCFPTLP
jgi:hypothetical protein